MRSTMNSLSPLEAAPAIVSPDQQKRALLERRLAAARTNRSAAEPVAKIPLLADRQGRLTLSFGQERLWFLEELGGLGGTYNVPVAVRLRGALDVLALSRALTEV